MPAPMVYPKGNPRYGSIETAGWTGLQKKLHTRTHTPTQWTARDLVASDMPLHANHYRNAMAKRAQRFLGMRLEIGEWGTGDWRSAKATTAAGNRQRGIVGCFTSHM